MRITIRSRILFIFVGVFCIQALIIGAFLLYQHNKDTHDQIRQLLKNNTENISHQVTSFFHGVQHDLETASHQIERIALKDYQRHNLLYTLQENNPVFRSLVFYDLNGTIQSFVSKDESETIPKCFIKNTISFSATYNTGKPFILPVTDENGDSCLIISQPVYFLNKSYIFGVISALVPYSNLQIIIDESIIPEHHTVMIFDRNNMLIAGKPLPRKFKTALTLSKKTKEKIVIDQKNNLVSRITIDFFGQALTIVSFVSKAKTINFFTKSFNELALLAFILLLISFFIGWTTYKKIIVPLQKLASSSSTMAQGDYVDNFQLSNDSEFHDLGIALHSMNQQLRDSNISMEQEVLKRREEKQAAIHSKLEAEKANQAKSIFLANMSHEIRTSLQGILGMLRMIKKDPLGSEQSRNLSLAFVAGDRLLTILNSILDLSQIESGKFQLIHSSFSLSELLTEVVDLMNFQANAKNIKVHSTIPKKLPDTLHGDSGRIRQILINLVSNAVKFSQQGSISIKVETVSSSKGDEIKLLFSITDTGDGISEKDQEKIFTAFERGKMESEIVVEGSGLGLAISCEFVEHMGGKLWLENTSSKGSTFCFTIHCAVDLTSSPPLHGVPVAEAKKRNTALLADIHVMLAEDEFINQRIITAYLEEMGARVTVCQHGLELLNKMQQEMADIILMDIRMPVMNGLEATEKIRALEAVSSLQPIPIVALTAQATTDFEEKCREAGMNDYLTKPVPFEKLVDIILNLVRT